MALPIFSSFMPTAVRWVTTAWRKEYRLLTDNRTGAPIGIQSQSADGPQGIWAPTPLSSDQIASPTADILADLNATFQSDTAPYNRYRSDGIQLVPLDGEGGTIIPPGINVVYFSPLVITEGHPLIIEGGVRVVA